MPRQQIPSGREVSTEAVNGSAAGSAPAKGAPLARVLGWLARLREDLEAARQRDPAVRSSAELLLGYSGLHAIWSHRLTHRMWQHPG